MAGKMCTRMRSRSYLSTICCQMAGRMPLPTMMRTRCCVSTSRGGWASRQRHISPMYCATWTHTHTHTRNTLLQDYLCVTIMYVFLLVAKQLFTSYSRASSGFQAITILIGKCKYQFAVEKTSRIRHRLVYDQKLRTLPKFYSSTSLTLH